MSHKWWHKWGSSPEDEALEQLEELRVQENRILQSNEKYGEGAVELSKDDLKEIQDQIKQIKIDNPHVEAIQSGFAADDTGIFGIPQETDILENIKREIVNIGLEKAGVPGIIDYGAATAVKEAFQQEGGGGAANTIVNLVKSYGIEKGIEMAMNTGIPVNTIISVLRSPMLEPWTGPFMSDAGTMFSDLTFGQGPKVWNWMNQPLNLFGDTGIMSNLNKKSKLEEITDDIYLGGGYSTDYSPTYIPPTPEIISPHGGAIIEEAGGMAPGGGYSTDYSPTYIPPTPEIISPHGGGQDMGSTTVSTPSWPNTPPPGYTPRPRPRPTHHFAQGGLVSMARVLRR